MGIPANHPAIVEALRRGLLTEVGPVARPAPALLSRVTLPVPPSTNALFVVGGNRKRVKSKPYREWLEAAVPLAAGLERPPLPCRFFYLVTGKVNASRDGDNLCKPLLDCCVEAGVIPDDSLRHVRGCCWEFEPTGGPPGVVVWFEGWTRDTDITV